MSSGGIGQKLRWVLAGAAPTAVLPRDRTGGRDILVTADGTHFTVDDRMGRLDATGADLIST
jgi:hypothetical protein